MSQELDQQDDSLFEASEPTLLGDSKERVALDLFKIVYIQANDMPDELTRQELLTLYNQCYNTVHGVDPEEIFAE